LKKALWLFLFRCRAIARRSVQLHGETIHHRKTADSGRGVDIHRCATCGAFGTRPPARQNSSSSPPAHSTDPTWFVPTSHIWASRAQPDVMFAPDALVIEGAPADRKPIWDRFNEIYPPKS
jgi:hypothetical protein